MAAHSGTGITGNTQTATTSSVELVGASTSGSVGFPRTVLIQNVDTTNPVYIGSNSGLTAANGFRIAAGESVSLDMLGVEVLHVIASTNVEVRFLIFNQVS
jgi:hypothetical protein